MLIAVDCIVPLLTEEINHHFEETDGSSFNLVNELSGKLKELNETGDLLTYKAMLETCQENVSLKEALELASWTKEFSLMKKLATPVDYARLELEKIPVPLREELLKCTDLYCYGEKLMEYKGAFTTEYGILVSHNGQTVKQCLDCPEQNMKMG